MHHFLALEWWEMGVGEVSYVYGEEINFKVKYVECVREAHDTDGSRSESIRVID